MALPVLHLREEGPGDRQGGEVGRHSGGDPAVHAQLDREVHGAELAGGAVAGDLSPVTAQRADGVLHRARRADRRGQRAARGHHAQPAQPRGADPHRPGQWLRAHPGGGL